MEQAARSAPAMAAQLPPTEATARNEAQAQLQAWLAQPLTQDNAVRIALLHQPALRVRLTELGIQDAQRVQALQLPNPHLTLGRLVNGHEREIERSLSFGLLDLITLPWRTQRQAEARDHATLLAAQDVLQVAADARRAWLRAVAAEQVAAVHGRMVEAAEAGAELAQRMARTGNWSKLQWAREQALLSDARASQARAQLAAATAREQLQRTLGLWGDNARFTLASSLPALPTVPADLLNPQALETHALEQRLDLQAARRQLDTTSTRAGWAGAAALFGSVGLGYQRNTTTERDSGHRDTTRGWELELPLPLFDWGGTARTAARLEVERSAAQLQDTALRARTEVRTAWLTYRTSHDLARQQRDEVLPLRALIQDETTLRYNGMLSSVWDLLAEARTAAAASARAIEAQRDFWLADTDLRLALIGALDTPATALGAAQPAAAAESRGH
jgi:outer membrane protein TolC